jgi:hypothetical protein
MKTKITAAQHERLEREMDKVLRTLKLHPASIKTMRDAWDVFALAKGYWLYDEGLNDAHIETALRQSFRIAR